MKSTGYRAYAGIALGGGIGGALRYGCVIAFAAFFGDAFPYGTLAVNAAGSFAIGWFATMTAADGRRPLSREIRLFFMTGVFGGFTTFSIFSLESLELARQDGLAPAAVYVAATLILCLGSVWAGHRTALKPFGAISPSS